MNAVGPGEVLIFLVLVIGLPALVLVLVLTLRSRTGAGGPRGPERPADPLASPLAGALAALVTYLDRRPASASPDGDVAALDEAAQRLRRLAPEEQRRLRPLLGGPAADRLGLDGG